MMMARPSVSVFTEWRTLLGTIPTTPGRTICDTPSMVNSSSPSMEVLMNGRGTKLAELRFLFSSRGNTV
jgi:hypothetical protein